MNEEIKFNDEVFKDKNSFLGSSLSVGTLFLGYCLSSAINLFKKITK